MSRALRIAMIIFAGACLIFAGALVLKKDEIKRLYAVKTVFDADKIVDNFSNMDRGFLFHRLDVPLSDDWTVETVPIPDTVDIAGTQRPLADVLAELDTTSLVILRDGKIIHESYYLGTGPDDLRISWSVAKSFMSGIYGNALADGDIASLDDEVTTYVPELKGTAYDGATLRNILNMSSGVRYNEDYLDQQSDINKMSRTIALGRSLDDYTTSLKERQFEPGSDWQYVSMDTHVAA